MLYFMTATRGMRQCPSAARQGLPLWLIRTLCGALALALGALFYVTDRAPGSASLIPPMPSLAGQRFFGPVGNWLPSFIHPLAFSLFSASLLAPCRRWELGACAAWFAVNVAFEIGQHTQVRGPLADALWQGLGDSALTRAMVNYFLRGTFDAGDLVAAALGAALAAGLLQGLHVHEEHRHGA
jgi:hypothetical protein